MEKTKKDLDFWKESIEAKCMSHYGDSFKSLYAYLEQITDKKEKEIAVSFCETTSLIPNETSKYDINNQKMYYKTRREAEKNRTDGARIWFVYNKGYYLIPKKNLNKNKIVYIQTLISFTGFASGLLIGFAREIKEHQIILFIISTILLFTNIWLVMKYTKN